MIKNNLLQQLQSVAILLFFFVVSFSCNSGKEEAYLVGSGFGINSATLLVEELSNARVYYRDTLGFNVPSKTDRSLIKGINVTAISFPDMSAFEIHAPEDSIAEEEKTAAIASFLEKNKGRSMYSISSSSTDSTSLWLSTQGFQMDSVIAFRSSAETPKGWSRDTGGPDTRMLHFANQDQADHHPAFVENVDFDYAGMRKQWNTYYAYGRRYNEHPNGVVGTAALIIAVNNLKVAIREYQKMGFVQLEADDSENVGRFRLIRNQEIHLIAPISAEDEISTFLKTNGQGLYAVRFEVDDLFKTQTYLQEKLPQEAMEMLDSAQRLVVFPDYAKGLQLEFIQESKEQGAMALKLRPDAPLDSTATLHASRLYAKYCALCHGDDRQGYAADNAPSLRSHSLLATSKGTNFMRYTIQYGREGTAMAGYRDLQGGPLEYIEIELLLKWLYEQAGVEEGVELSREPIIGDIALGEKLYETNCSSCHGKEGEGISAPALGNSMLLATATDHFLRYAIAEGRDGTPMVGFKEQLSTEEIDGITAFLRSRASGWDIPQKGTVSIPKPENYILNPNNKSPKFTLKEGRYLPAEQLMKALQDSLRIVILDARSEVAWRQMHIPGAIPVPYYEEPETFVNTIPNDSTWVIAYCACPHAASGKVMNTLRRNGFKNTAILDEGILVWGQLGYPVQNGN